MPTPDSMRMAANCSKTAEVERAYGPTTSPSRDIGVVFRPLVVGQHRTCFSATGSGATSELVFDRGGALCRTQASVAMHNP